MSISATLNMTLNLTVLEAWNGENETKRNSGIPENFKDLPAALFGFNPNGHWRLE